MVGQHARMSGGLFGSILRTPKVRAEEKRAHEKAGEMLELVGLSAKQFDQTAINLSYGDQRRVEIARALASDPQLLLLDEPTAGMNPRGVRPPDALHGAAARRARPDDPAHRARHEGRHERVRAHHGARPRREDRRGRPGRPCAPTRRSSRRTSESRLSDHGAARSRRHPHVLRQHRGAQGRVAEVAGGRVRHADRLQRRRQVDDAAVDLGPVAGAHRADPLRRRATSRTPRPRRSCGSASRSRPRAGAASRA